MWMTARALTSRLSRVTTSGRYFPEVDGIRFVAIGLVFWQHAQQHVLAYEGDRTVRDTISKYVENARIGVELFFLLSGFILGLPFAMHCLRGGRPVSLKAYFIRRLTRLEPPYFLAMCLCFLLWVFYHGESPRRLWPHLVAGISYCHGLVYKQFNPINTVTWSLEVEVQFYIAAPVLALMFRIGLKWLRRLAMVSASLLAFAIRKFIERYWQVEMPPTLLSALPYFMAGFLLADVFASEWGGEAPQTDRRAWRWDVIALVVWLALGATFLRETPAKTLSTAVLLFVCCLATLRGVVIRRCLACWPVRTIGGMCYSIYLLHLQALDVSFALWPRHSITGWLSCDGGIAVLVTGVPILVVSTIYFVVIEQPCMRKDWPARLRAWTVKLVSASDHSAGS